MYKTLTILFSFFFLITSLSGQSFRVMSYNVENLFDTVDNPLTEDDEFLPSGNRRWTGGRYYNKLQQIAKVINAAGEWDTPAIIGLCEVENDTVVTHLLTRTPLRNQHYKYCISETSDRRGINVALLYQRDKFRYLGHCSNPVKTTSGTSQSTRDILHVWGEISTGDTLDLAVCHFPSKYGGEKESESRRLNAAKALRRLADSLTLIRTYPLIILMGDFNDTPDSRTLDIIKGENFHNLFEGIPPNQTKGSHKYQGEWSQLDHMLIHKQMSDKSSRMRIIQESVRNFSPSFLFIEDKTRRGIRPRRSYYGFKYEGGYSDHLPVMADFLLSLP